MKILYEDNHLLVVEKPVNMPVQADASHDPDLLTALKAYVKEKYQKPGDVYLGLVHRLDRPVGGVMVFARTSKAAQRLASQFSGHTAAKRYAAIVRGTPLPQAKLTDYLVKDEAANQTAVVSADTPGAKLARLSYRTLARDADTALLDVELYTGRPHQIRVQLSHAGLPVVGDMRYGTDAPGTQIRLWAYALSLQHPTLGETMIFYSIPPWTEYPAQRKLLPAFSSCTGVYEDDELLVVDKNAGVEVEDGLMAELSAFYDPLYAVHRLDANTEGLTVFARTDSMRDRLLDAFRAHETKKQYHALVVGSAPDAGRLVDYAIKDAQAGLMRLCDAGEPGALRMELAYRTLARHDGLSLLEIELLTGRTHQIRIQTAHAGFPVLGDDKYGDRDANRRYHVRRQQLLSKRLSVFGLSWESCRALSFGAQQ